MNSFITRLMARICVLARAGHRVVADCVPHALIRVAWRVRVSRLRAATWRRRSWLGCCIGCWWLATACARSRCASTSMRSLACRLARRTPAAVEARRCRERQPSSYRTFRALRAFPLRDRMSRAVSSLVICASRDVANQDKQGHAAPHARPAPTPYTRRPLRRSAAASPACRRASCGSRAPCCPQRLQLGGRRAAQRALRRRRAPSRCSSWR